MNLTSTNIIYVKEYEGKKFYRARVSRKKENGEYENAYIDVKMPKDTNIENKTKINITKGFLSFYKTKDDKDIWYIVVLEYTTEKQAEKVEVGVVETYTADQLELPF